jgi:rhamnogalacturonyl hydrolase YesR
MTEKRVQEAFCPEGIVALADRINTYALNNPYHFHRGTGQPVLTDRNWIRATWYSGVMEFYLATGRKAYLEQAIRWAEEHQWQVGTEASGGNRLFCAMTWAQLYLIDPEPKKIAPTLQWLAADAPNSPGGAKVWYGHAPAPYDGPLYSDSLYGAPVFAMLYKATGDRKYLDILHQFFWDVTDTVLDKDDTLYYRDPSYIGTKSPNGKKVLWSRGNGWVFAAIPRILDSLPKDDPNYERYVDLYRRMARSLAQRQQDDGFWRANLADPWHIPMPESSGTAFFVAGYAWGIRTGVLDKATYLPVMIRGWNALVNAVHPNGKLGWVQPVDGQPRPSLPETTHEYAVGPMMTAAGHIYVLAKEGVLTAEAVQDAIQPQSALLPPSAMKSEPLSEHDHPLSEQIMAFRHRQGQVKEFSPTGLDEQEYLRIIAGQVKAMRPYQNNQGRIIDPVEKREKYFATPCYAHSVSALAVSGFQADADLVESGMKALDAALDDMATGRPVEKHGDFYTWPMMLAYENFKTIASADRAARWKTRLAEISPDKVYRNSPLNKPIIPLDEWNRVGIYEMFGTPIGNWNLVNVSGEYLRAKEGLTDLKYVDFCLTMQLHHFTPEGLYNEHGDPLAYDLFARHYAAGMLQRGYRSFLYTTYRDILWRGAWTSLLMQSPFGELPTGYRSSHHLWNEAEQAVVFEIVASEYANAGRLAEAGAFKRAARLALSSVKNWIRPDGSGYIVKNHYPIEAKHGYERYSAHTCYNLLTASMLAQAFQAADPAIPETPAPADVGGFAFAQMPFRKVFANVGGNYVQYQTDGDVDSRQYNPTGLIRIHLAGGHPQLGPSDGCAAYFSGDGVNFAVGPAWRDGRGQWHKLADVRGVSPTVEILEQTASKARFRVSYDVSLMVVRQEITVDASGVTVIDEVSGDVDRMRVYFPALVFDGRNNTEMTLKRNTARLSLDGKSVRLEVVEPKDVVLVAEDNQYKHRNGMIVPVVAECIGTKVVYRVYVD